MTRTTRRIRSVQVDGATALLIQWEGGGQARVDLAGWIGTGGDLLAPLANAAVFAKAKPAEYASSVAWDDGDLRIDATHLALLAAEQRPFGAEEAAEWQRTIGLSNQETAAMLGLALSTWNSYKAGATIPASVAIACRAALRDPITLQAHFRPRPPAGRPRRTA